MYIYSTLGLVRGAPLLCFAKYENYEKIQYSTLGMVLISLLCFAKYEKSSAVLSTFHFGANRILTYFCSVADPGQNQVISTWNRTLLCTKIAKKGTKTSLCSWLLGETDDLKKWSRFTLHKPTTLHCSQLPKILQNKSKAAAKNIFGQKCQKRENISNYFQFFQEQFGQKVNFCAVNLVLIQNISFPKPLQNTMQNFVKCILQNFLSPQIGRETQVTRQQCLNPKMNALPKTFLRIALAAKWLVRHLSTSPKQQRRPLQLLFCIFLLL